MNKDRMQDFTRRVSQATDCGLIVILYDMVLADIAEAEACFQEGAFDAFEKELKHACRVVNELMAVLDYQIPLSHELLALYSFVNKAVIKAYISRKPALLEAPKYVVTNLQKAFAQIDAESCKEPAMGNVQKVYAGLTYGKGILNEQVLDAGQEKRGFKA